MNCGSCGNGSSVYSQQSVDILYTVKPESFEKFSVILSPAWGDRLLLREEMEIYSLHNCFV
jgi:hypothetical protein